MSTGLQNKLTGQIAEHLVCAELGRRDLIATPFAGNVPSFDVIVADSACRTIPIQVKATRGNNWPTRALEWMEIEFDPSTGRQNYRGPKDISNPSLIYVCVVLGDLSQGTQDRFFILTKSDVQAACIASYSYWMDKHDWCRPKKPESYDCRYTIEHIAGFEGKWELIQERLAQG